MTIVSTDPSPRAFAYPAFRRYYTGAVLGTNGGWIVRILLSWLAWDLTKSPTFVGAVAAASLLPVAIVGPIFGAIVDRMSVKTAMIRVALALFLVPMLLLTAIATDSLSPPLLFVLAMIFGIVMSAYHPVRQSLGPRLVEQPAIASVVSLAALNFNIGRLLAPAIGGAIIAKWGILPTAILAVVMMFPNALIAPTLTPRQGKPREPKSLARDLAQGFQVAWQRPDIRRPILIAVAALGLIRGISEILALIADGLFMQGAQGLGLLTSAVGGGALIAAIVQVWSGNRYVNMRGLRLVLIGVGFMGTMGLVHAPSFGWSLAAAPLVGFSSTWVGVSLQIGMQNRLEDELRGRVMSIWMLSNTASVSILAFLISALTEWIGMPAATTIVTVFAALAVSVIWVKRPPAA